MGYDNLKDKKKLKLKECKLCHREITAVQVNVFGFHYPCWWQKHNLEDKKKLKHDTTWQHTIAERKRLHKCLRCGKNNAVGGGRVLCKICDHTTPYT